MSGSGRRAVAVALTIGLVLAALLAPRRLGAQYLTRPAVAWETIETARFRFHFPAEMRRWVTPIAQRMESYAEAVNALVGNEPEARVTVMVEDPANVSNGFVVPFLEGAVVFLWPTPPSPTPSFGEHRGWGEVLAVHEYAHVAHLTIPPRNPNERLLWRLAPARIGPVARKAPPWVIEGYATYLEGKLTGNGRPNSVGRAAILRQWALEGRLPTYRELDATGSYLGGSMRYLAGSAFLEWLAARKGEESLNHLWRRMSARRRRSFDEAFRGVWGASADALYGAFFTEVMGKAIESGRQLQGAGVVEGELVQHLAWGTGEPALSRDGSRVALVLRSPNRPSRLVVWRSSDEPLDSAAIRARRRMLELDPLDVLPFDSFPPPKKAVKTLYPVGGRGHDLPRWFADGERLLVTRDEATGDGTSRPDLFEWSVWRGGLRRVTRGAGVRGGDPSPDGASAAAVRCAAGVCDLVRVDLTTGSWTTLAAGSPFVVWHRPRWSPDGSRIAAGVQRDGRWSVTVVDASTGKLHAVDPGDGANRHSPAWTRDGELVVVSERGGVANLEVLDPQTGKGRMLTRVVGGVAAPDVGPDGRVWHLALHARGYDVRRISSRTEASTALVDSGRSPDPAAALDARLYPVAARPPSPADSFPSRPIPPPGGYGWGPRGWRVLPGASAGPDGDMLSLMVANMDPVGRLNVVAQGGYGSRAAWRGGSLAAALRALPVGIEGSAWHTEHAPSRQRATFARSLDLDARYTGGALAVRHGRDFTAWGYAMHAGGSVGRVDGSGLDAAARTFAFVDVRARRRWAVRDFGIAPQLLAQGSAGATDSDAWARTVVSGSLSLGSGRRALRLDATVGRVTAAAPGEAGRSFERFAVGGAQAPFFDPVLWSQRVSLPSVPVGFASGRKLALYSVSLPLLGARSYATWVAAGDSSLGSFRRVLGAERQVDVGAIGFARLPATRIRVGVGYSLDEPYSDRVRAYFAVTYRP